MAWSWLESLVRTLIIVASINMGHHCDDLEENKAWAIVSKDESAVEV